MMLKSSRRDSHSSKRGVHIEYIGTVAAAGGIPSDHLIMKAVILCVLAIASSTWGLTPVSEQFQRGMKKVFAFSQAIDSSEVIAKMYEEHIQGRNDFTIPDPVFTCDTSRQNQKKATSVHQLAPGDVALVASIGDSVTAGYGVGANNLVEVPIQNRGESWSIGGERDFVGPEKVVTLTNILRKWNPDVTGFAMGTGGIAELNSGLNRAVGGATNRNMREQAEDLVNRINTDSRYNMDDWKVVTVFVGGNDLCASCNNPDFYGPTAYRDGIKSALDYWHDNLPKALVQVATMFDVTPLTELSTGVLCDVMQSGFCSCVTNPATRPSLRETQMEYWRLVEELISSGVYDTKDDFTVVMQPQMRDIVPPKDQNAEYIKAFLSYDCFHPSRPSHQLFALALWDAMLQPVGGKEMPTELDVDEPWPMSCPSARNPYFYTNLNSVLAYKEK